MQRQRRKIVRLCYHLLYYKSTRQIRLKCSNEFVPFRGRKLREAGKSHLPTYTDEIESKRASLVPHLSLIRSW